MSIDISVRGLQNDMINLSENGGLKIVVYSVTQKIMIIDIILR